METLHHELEISMFYVKIHLSSANHQILLDDEVQDVCVINTTLDVFKLLRLHHGMKNPSGIFQQTLEIVWKTRDSPLTISSLKISWREPLFAGSQFHEAGLSPIIVLSLFPGRPWCILEKSWRIPTSRRAPCNLCIKCNRYNVSSWAKVV